jgi:hypothetical protein
MILQDKIIARNIHSTPHSQLVHGRCIKTHVPLVAPGHHARVMCLREDDILDELDEGRQLMRDLGETSLMDQ